MSRKTLLTLSLLPTFVLFVVSAVIAVGSRLSVDSAGSGASGAGSGIAGAVGAFGLALVFVLFLAAAVFTLFTFLMKLVARAVQKNVVTFLVMLLDLVVVVFCGALAKDSLMALASGGEISVFSLVLLGVSVLPVALDLGSMFAD